MNIDKPTEALVSRVQSLILDYQLGKIDPLAFCRWMMDYGHQASQILTPPSTDADETPEPDYDCFRNFRRFANSQQVVDFCHKHKLTLAHNSFWWWLSSDQPGHLTGIVANGDEVIRGIPRITDGIQMWVERPDGQLSLVHREWWRKDKKLSQAGPTKPKIVKEKVCKELEEFFL